MSTDTRVAPYYDDFDPNKNFAQILFRPGTYVQARELNQLQTILQTQIARFGDNILKQGTIVSGCSISHLPKIPFVKLKDKTTSGKAVEPASYFGKRVVNSSGLSATIVSGISGTEAGAPDLNTLYLRYINAGASTTEQAFSEDQTLTIYDPSYPIENVSIVSGSAGYANTDTIHFLSSIRVTNTAGGNTFSAGFYAGDRIFDGAGANVLIKSVTYDDLGALLTLSPTNTDHLAANTAAWSITLDSTLSNANTAQTAVVTRVLGSGARANVTTNGIGAVDKIDLYSKGSGYETPPTAFVLSSTATSTQLQNTSLVAENFSAQVTVAPSLYGSVGNGYALTIDEGVIFQNGYFTRTDKQLVVVGKYTELPDDVAVGFDTTASIVTEEEDSSLYDNVYGSPNYQAPGAHRLKIAAQAIVLPRAEAAARPDFLSIVELTEGEPYKVEPRTQYNVIQQEMARRTAEESGNYVIDPFGVTTKSSTINLEPTQFNIVVDPGVAYIDGYRVATERNYTGVVTKATATESLTEVNASVSYGNYIYLNSLIGNTSGIIGSVVSLRNAAFTGAIGAAPSAPGAEIGQARVKAVQPVSQGLVNSYRVYLFDVKMNSGALFSDVRSLYFNTAVGNVDTSYPVALVDPNTGSNIVKMPADALQSIGNVSFTYQKSSWGTLTTNTSGVVSLTTSAPDKFPVAGTLSAEERNKIVVTPLATAQATAPLTGTVTLTAASPTIVGSSTAFASELTVGRYVRFVNATASFDTRVIGITNATSITVSPAPGANMAGNTHVLFPANIPTTPSSVVVSGDQLGMTISLGTNIPATNVSVLTPVRTVLTPGTKTITRNAVARVNLATHAAGINGPWAVGVSDVVRMVGVYLGTTTTFTTATSGIVDVTNHFYIDNDQNAENIGMAYLYRKPGSSLTLSTTQRLLVLFDVLSHSSTAAKTLASYPVNDALTLAASSATVNTMEIPEVQGQYDQYFDLRDCIDFRPLTANTIAVQTTQSTAPINPAEPVYASKYAAVGVFPAPDTTIEADLVRYLPRRDRVVVTTAGDIKTITGTPNTNLLPEAPVGSITINDLSIPPYPSLPNALSTDMAVILDTKISSEKLQRRRVSKYTVTSTLSRAEIEAQQPRGYKMSDIGSIDRRLEAVEYYLALTLAEQATKNRVLPSSINADSDRFKFGFVVDSFADTLRSDFNNPEYTADISENVLKPRSKRYALPLVPNDDESLIDGVITLPYNEYVLVDQNQATDGPVVTVTPAPPVVDPGNGAVTPPIDIVPGPLPVANTVVQVQSIAFVRNAHELVNKNGSVSEISEFLFSSTDGQAELYFNFRDNKNGIEIYQGDTPGFSIAGKTPIKDARAAVAVTNFEKTQKMYNMGKHEQLDTIVYLGVPAKPATEDSGKIVWNHVAANGRYYKVVVIKYKKSGSIFGDTKGEFKYRLFYPADEVVTAPVVPIPTAVGFAGSITRIDPPVFNTNTFATGLGVVYYSDAQVFNITVSGLKPMTQHNFFYDGVNASAKCRLAGSTNLSDPLVSDASGNLVFDFFYDAGVAPATTPYQQLNNINNQTASPKFVLISNGDNTSTASGIIGIKSYAAPQTLQSGGVVSSGRSGMGRLEEMNLA